MKNEGARCGENTEVKHLGMDGKVGTTPCVNAGIIKG